MVTNDMENWLRQRIDSVQIRWNEILGYLSIIILKFFVKVFSKWCVDYEGFSVVNNGSQSQLTGLFRI